MSGESDPDETDRAGIHARHMQVVLAHYWNDRIRPGSCPPTADDIATALQRVGRAVGPSPDVGPTGGAR